jgi:hypothetical protein
MKKKKSIPVAIIGWLIIISNLIYLNPILASVPYLDPICHALTRLWAVPIFLAFNLMPIYLLGIFPPANLTVTFLVSIFFLFIGICILQFVKLARNIVIAMSGVIIFEQVVRIVRGYHPHKRVLILAWIIIALSIITHSVYIYCLTRSKVKEQFNRVEIIGKKGSKGVIAFAVLFLGCALLWTYTTMHTYVVYNTHRLTLLILLPIAFISLAFLTSVGLFTLKKWGRKLALALGSYFWLYVMYRAIKDSYHMSIYNHEISISFTIVVIIIWLTFTVVPTFLLWWFFTRSKVKGQFN